LKPTTPTKSELYEKLSAEQRRTAERRRKSALYVKTHEEKMRAAGMKKIAVWTALTADDVRALVAAEETARGMRTEAEYILLTENSQDINFL